MLLLIAILPFQYEILLERLLERTGNWKGSGKFGTQVNKRLLVNKEGENNNEFNIK